MFGTERNAVRGPVEHLRYSIYVYDDRNNLIEMLAWLADLMPARAGVRGEIMTGLRRARHVRC